MKKYKILVVTIIILILLSIFLYTNSNKKITGEVITELNTYTTAICNDSNFCQDYIVKCENTEIKELSPITGAVTQKPDKWIDKRNKTKLCSVN